MKGFIDSVVSCSKAESREVIEQVRAQAEEDYRPKRSTFDGSDVIDRQVDYLRLETDIIRQNCHSGPLSGVIDIEGAPNEVTICSSRALWDPEVSGILSIGTLRVADVKLIHTDLDPDQI